MRRRRFLCVAVTLPVPTSNAAKTVVVPSGKYFGKYYQDIQKRVPSIAHVRKQLGWNPKVDLKTAIRLTLDYHLAHKDYSLE